MQPKPTNLDKLAAMLDGATLTDKSTGLLMKFGAGNITIRYPAGGYDRVQSMSFALDICTIKEGEDGEHS